MDIVGNLLQVVGILVVLVNAVWLAGGLFFPREMTQLEATGRYLPAILVGSALFYIGHRLYASRMPKSKRRGSQQKDGPLSSDSASSEEASS